MPNKIISRVRHQRPHPPATLVPRPGRERPAQCLGPLAHAADSTATAQPGSARDRDRSPVVLDDEFGGLPVVRESDLDLCLRRVAQRVGERLASDAVHRGGERRGWLAAGELQRDPLPELAEPGGQPGQRRRLVLSKKYVVLSKENIALSQQNVVLSQQNVVLNRENGDQPAQRVERVPAGARGERQRLRAQLRSLGGEPLGRLRVDDDRRQVMRGHVVQLMSLLGGGEPARGGLPVPGPPPADPPERRDGAVHDHVEKQFEQDIGIGPALHQAQRHLPAEQAGEREQHGPGRAPRGDAEERDQFGDSDRRQRRHLVVDRHDHRRHGQRRGHDDQAPHRPA